MEGLPTIVASVLAAALISTLGYLGVRRTLEVQERQHALTRQEEADRLLRRYRDPLIRATFDLQSRLYNIAVNDFLKHAQGTPAEQEYARESTLYVIGEYFCWVEIMRKEVQFLDLREFAKNRALSERLDMINRVLLSEPPSHILRVFRGEQRAIGEVMMADTAVAGGRECIGYATFIERRKRPGFARWFAKLAEDVDTLARDPEERRLRLVLIQHALIDLIDLLDPDHRYFPPSRRQKIAVPSPGARSIPPTTGAKQSSPSDTGSS